MNKNELVASVADASGLTKADAAKARFMDKLKEAKPGPKNKQNFKEKGTKLDKKKAKGYKKGGSIDGCAIKGHTRAKR